MRRHVSVGFRRVRREQRRRAPRLDVPAQFVIFGDPVERVGVEHERDVEAARLLDQGGRLGAITHARTAGQRGQFRGK